MCPYLQNMKKSKKKIINNISLTVTANVIVAIVSMVTNLIAPKILGVKEYGYWQMYILYVGYVGIVQLGWSEGIYLKLGGKKITELKEEFLDVQFKWYILFQLIIALIFILITYKSNLPNKWIYIIVALMIFPSNLKNFCNYLLLSTNEMKSYAKVTIIDRAIFLFGLIYCFSYGKSSIQNILGVDCLARILSGIYNIKKVTPIFYHRFRCTKKIVLEIFDNINCGSKLLIANLASTLIVGIIKMVVGWRWGISTFSHISFTISITNLVLVLINAIGIALFPVLKTITTEQLIKTYLQLRMLLSFCMIICLWFYFPIKVLLCIWLPNYKISLEYMGLIFPLIIYETRTALLLNTYYKALRLEKWLLFGNVIGVIVSFLIAIISAYVLNSKNAVIISIFIVLLLRCIFLEVYLGKVMKINIKKSNLFELLIAIIFIFSASYAGGISGAILYGIIVIIYFIVNVSHIKNIINWGNIIR